MATPRVELQELTPIAVAVVQRTVRQSELSRVVPEGCGIVWKALKERSVPAGRNVAIYWDGAIRLEVGVELLGPFIDRDGVVRSATPGGRVASITHFGPYQTLGASHSAIVNWCKAEGHRLAGPSWEIYGHWDQAWDKTPASIRTDIFYQLSE